MHISFKIKYFGFENDAGKIINNSFIETNNTFGNINSKFNNNYNIRILFGNLFKCNSYNN